MRYSMIAAIILTLALAACGDKDKLPAFVEQSRDIGPAPDYLKEKWVRPPHPGENAAVRERVARGVSNEQNFIICAARAEWDATRAAFLAGKGPPVKTGTQLSPATICRMANSKR